MIDASAAAKTKNMDMATMKKEGYEETDDETAPQEFLSMR